MHLALLLWNAIHLESSEVACPSAGKRGEGLLKGGRCGWWEPLQESAACLACVFAYISSSELARCQEKHVHCVAMALVGSLLGLSSGLWDPPHRSFPKQLGPAPGRKQSCTEVNKPAFQGGVPGLGKSTGSAARLALHALHPDFCLSPSRFSH